MRQKVFRMLSVPERMTLPKNIGMGARFVLRGTSSPDYFEVHPEAVEEGRFKSSKFLGIVSKYEVKNHFEEIK